ncbi:MAG: CDP-alcohol phosphatidyltransferase family protein [Filimonas sp.]|nr:CDP-alcohol phosphatidyltransferase family protein [Filimonas sp.]
MSIKTKLPWLLIWFRIVAGLVIVLLSFTHIAYYSVIAVTLLSLGLLSDVFDGIIARRLKISTVTLRRFDSTADVLFFLLVAGAAYAWCPGFFNTNWLKIVVLIGFEALTYVVSFARFKKEIATHSIGAKIWTLFLFATLTEVFIHCESNLLFNLCFWIGLLTRVEIMAIVLLLKEWTNDVPTIYHALQLRKGKAIKRNDLFNG